MHYLKGIEEHLVDGRIPFVGPDVRPTAKRPLVFRHYDPNQQLMFLGQPRTMADIIRPSWTLWHGASNELADIFGPGTTELADRPWLGSTDPFTAAVEKADATTELVQATGFRFVAMHVQHDLVAPGRDHAETTDRILSVLPTWTQFLAQRDIGVLWTTPNNFTDRRFATGSGTACRPNIFALGGAQFKVAIDVGVALNAEGLVGWSGRDGERDPLTTDIVKEFRSKGALLRKVVDYADKVGFSGGIHIEPKPFEPSMGQYDRDVMATAMHIFMAGVSGRVGVNIEADHAKLALLDFNFEILKAGALGVFHSLDVNAGDPRVGYDVDRFVRDLKQTVLMWLCVMRAGGFKNGGGCNFDAKPPRHSPTLLDLVGGHVMGLDVLAAALKIAVRIVEDGELSNMLDLLYGPEEEWNEVLSADCSLEDLSERTLAAGDIPRPPSVQGDVVEHILNSYIF